MSTDSSLIQSYTILDVQSRKKHTEFLLKLFNQHVKIVFYLVDVNQINLSIVNTLGETARTSKSQHYARGLSTIVWNGKNDFGHDFSTGVYFRKLKSENIDNSIKLLYVK